MVKELLLNGLHQSKDTCATVRGFIICTALCREFVDNEVYFEKWTSSSFCFSIKLATSLTSIELIALGPSALCRRSTNRYNAVCVRSGCCGKHLKTSCGSLASHCVYVAT